MHPDDLRPDDYRQAFQRIHHLLSEKQIEMLRAHCLAPERRITAKQLAAVVNSNDYRTANSMYGKIGGLLGDLLGAEPDHAKLFVLVNFSRPDGEWIWELRGPAAQALKDLRWFESSGQVH